MNLRIGIDFDNTIVNYDSAFKKIAAQYKYISKNWDGNKQQLRNEIIKKDSVETWKKLQGLVYGKYIYLAKLNEGIEKFLIKSKLINSKIFIVSHKTIYGHYDKRKILLRKAALDWIKNRNFFIKKLIKKENIYFEESIENKVKRINQLKLNFFIDDLELILKNKKLNKNIKKILFNELKKKNKNSNIIQHSKWENIDEYIYGNNNSEVIKNLAEFTSKKKIFKIKKIKGQKNSQVFKIFFRNRKNGLLKQYPNESLDNRKRLIRDFLATKLLKKNNINCVPKPLCSNELFNISIFEWVNGKKIIQPSNNDLNQAINFIQNLKKLSRKKISSYPYNAVECCKSLKDILIQIEYKLSNLLNANTSQKIKKFVNFYFRPAFKNIKSKKISNLYLKPLNSKLQILSPSDFGFHNSLKTKKNKIIFFDLEYFGKDDPVKLAADFLLHPGMTLNLKQKKIWISKITVLFKNDKNFLKRLYLFIPFYALRWSLIVLNDYKIINVDEYCKRRKIRKNIFLKSREEQIKKAYYFYNLVKKEEYKKWFN